MRKVCNERRQRVCRLTKIVCRISTKIQFVRVNAILDHNSDRELRKTVEFVQFYNNITLDQIKANTNLELKLKDVDDRHKMVCR